MGNLGIWAAIGAALAWGSYNVPFKKSHSSNFILFQLLTSVGILLSSIILSLIFGYAFDLNTYGLLSGMLWASANAVSLVAIANLGLSRAVPLMSSLVVVSSFLWGVFYFKEIPSGMLMGFAGIGLIILGIILISTTTKTLSINIKKGLAAAIFSGTVWGSQLVPLKIAALPITISFFPVAVGIFLTATIIAIVAKVKFSNIPLKYGLLSGVIWNLGNLLSLLSIALIGLAKGMPIAQSATLIAVCWGLFYFKEVTKFRLKMQVLIGAIILLGGVVILSLT